MHPARRTTLIFTLMAYLGLFGLPGNALADTTEAVAETGGMSIGIVGVPIVINVTLDAAGHIATVSVGDVTFDQASDVHKIQFSKNDGATSVEIKAKDDKLKAQVKTESVDDVVGEHTWSADVFGTNGETIVMFTVAMSAGHPEITDVVVDKATLPPGATVEIVGPESEIEDDEAESKARVIFTYNGSTKTLKIEVEHELDDDDGSSVKLKVQLRGRDDATQDDDHDDDDDEVKSDDHDDDDDEDKSDEKAKDEDHDDDDDEVKSDDHDDDDDDDEVKSDENAKDEDHDDDDDGSDEGKSDDDDDGDKADDKAKDDDDKDDDD